MQRNYFRGLLICLIPCLLAGVFVVRLDKYRLGIDLAGGTILVYEINLERTKLRLEAMGEGGAQPAPTGDAAAGLDSTRMHELAAQIKRRIDPTDIKNVTVRPLGGSRVEIILPKSGSAGSGRENLSDEEIEEVKRLISQMGVLEFRILANGTDDAAGILAARAALDGKSAEELSILAKKGLAPEGPEGTFTVNIGETSAPVRYIWTELGPEYRESMGLSNAEEGKGGLWNLVAASRNKTIPLAADPSGGYRPTDNQGAMKVLYSRVCESTEQLAKEKMERERLIREGKTEAEADALVDRKKYEYFVLTRVSPEDSLLVRGDVTLNASAGTDRSFNPAVDFTFNGEGAKRFGKITRRNKPSGSIQRSLAILLDDRIVSAPNLQGEITSHGQITGKFDAKSVNQLVQILRSGTLSAELRGKPVSENTIGPTLGRDTIQKGTFAVGMAFIAILVFMVIYYRFAGMVASIALFANLFLTIGFMVAVNAAFTLPGLAGLVLTLGMAVDANVLIYERLREERNKGANLATAIRNGYDRAFLTIIDTHLTSIFTAIVLYTFGNDQLKGFAISLTVGLVISLFTSLYMTRLMFDYWLHRKWLTQLRMMRLFERPNFHPMKYRYIFFSITGALTVLGLGLFLYRGEASLNVDFRGGTVLAGRLKEGEERALNKTSDGKLGFRDLLSEENQRARLTPVRAVRINKETKAADTYVYNIEYKEPSGQISTSTITLTQRPDGDTEEAMEQSLLERARHLPDISVEQMSLSGETFTEGKTRYFTIRTTEKQPELVRATLDRLLRDANGVSLMYGAVMTYPQSKDAAGQELPAAPGGVIELTFSRPTSRTFVEELIERELNSVGITDRVVHLTGVGEPVDSRFTKMRLDVSKNAAFDKLTSTKPEDAAERTRQTQQLGRVLAGTKTSFDATPEPERLEVFDSQLASETREKAFLAIAASWIAILLYLWFRFGNWTFGLAAVICLVHDLCFTLGAIAACHYLHLIPVLNAIGIQDFKIDLAAVAALLTLVGYSVNEIIVNFARVREVRGKNPLLTPQMINDSVNQTLSRTILTSMTVFLVSSVLFTFGGEGVHLFAFVMVMGVLISTYSSIFVASPLLLFLGEGRHPQPEAAQPAEESADSPDKEEEVVEG